MNAHPGRCVTGCSHPMADAARLPHLVLSHRERASRRPIGILSGWRTLVAFLRRWSGDDAYERYLADHRHHGHALLSRREFYRRYLDHRAGGSRCC